MDVLIVEDDVLVAEVLVEALGRKGLEAYAVTTLEDAESERALLRAGGTIVIDIDLRGADAFGWFERTASLHPYPSHRYILVSSDRLDPLQGSWLEAARGTFLRKPFPPRQLAAAIRGGNDGRRGGGVGGPRRRTPPDLGGPETV